MPMEGLPPPAKAELQKLQQKNVLLDVTAKSAMPRRIAPRGFDRSGAGRPGHGQLGASAMDAEAIAYAGVVEGGPVGVE